MPDDYNSHLEQVHVFSKEHRTAVEHEGAVLGCFYCQTIFSLDGTVLAEDGWRSVSLPRAALEWIDEETTLLCPFCGIDAILSSADVGPITRELLRNMTDYWFTCSQDVPKNASEVKMDGGG